MDYNFLSSNTTIKATYMDRYFDHEIEIYHKNIFAPLRNMYKSIISIPELLEQPELIRTDERLQQYIIDKVLAANSCEHLGKWIPFKCEINYERIKDDSDSFTKNYLPRKNTSYAAYVMMKNTSYKYRAILVDFTVLENAFHYHENELSYYNSEIEARQHLIDLVLHANNIINY